MKNLSTRSLLFIFLMIVSVRANSQAKIDTIYYDNNWKSAYSKEFATFYRIVPHNENDNVVPFIDYYMNGQKQYTGFLRKVDPNDDANTIFGDGEFIRYYENGLIAERYFRKDGVFDGVYTSFSEDGKITYRRIFRNGIGDEQIEISTIDGLYSIYDISRKKQIFNNISTNSRQVDYQDGVTWQYYNNGGLMIACNLTEGDYYDYKARFIISNQSCFPIEIDVASQMEAIGCKKNGAYFNLEVWDLEEFRKKNNRIALWTGIAAGVAAASESYNAGYSQSTTAYSGSSTTYGSAYGSYYNSNGTYGNINANGISHTYNSGVSTTISYNALEAYQQRELIADKYGAQMQQLSDHLNALDAGYMKHNVVYPNQTISGFVLVEKHRKAESTSINVIIDGVSYIFSWKTD